MSLSRLLNSSLAFRALLKLTNERVGGLVRLSTPSSTNFHTLRARRRCVCRSTRSDVLSISGANRANSVYQVGGAVDGTGDDRVPSIRMESTSPDNGAMVPALHQIIQ